jgi:Zn-dependent alcohol dehydrogenase
MSSDGPVISSARHPVASTAVEVGEPRGLWFRVRSRSAGVEHADLSRISPQGRAEFRPAAPLYEAPGDQPPVRLVT